MIQISVLGPLGITVDGRPARIPKKARALLAYLALHPPGTFVTRERFADLLWPYQGSEQARHSLRNCLMELRRALGPASAELECNFHTVRLVAPDTDVERFIGLVESQRLEDLDLACRLYRGELLDDLEIASESWEEWLAAERARLHEIAARALFRLSRLASAAGRHTDAIAATRRLLALEPYREAAHRRMMLALIAADRRGDAVLQYRDCERVLRRELGVVPGVKTRNLFREIQAREMLLDPATEADREAAIAANEIIKLRAALAAEIARNAEMTCSLEKLSGILRELTAAVRIPAAGGNGHATAALMERLAA